MCRRAACSQKREERAAEMLLRPHTDFQEEPHTTLGGDWVGQFHSPEKCCQSYSGLETAAGTEPPPPPPLQALPAGAVVGQAWCHGVGQLAVEVFWGQILDWLPDCCYSCFAGRLTGPFI